MGGSSAPVVGGRGVDSPVDGSSNDAAVFFLLCWVGMWSFEEEAAQKQTAKVPARRPVWGCERSEDEGRDANALRAQR